MIEPNSIWYVYTGDGQVGPFSVREIREQLASSQITSEHSVWREGFTDWLPISSVEELSDPALTPIPVRVSTDLEPIIESAPPTSVSKSVSKKSIKRSVGAIFFVLLLAAVAYFFFGQLPEEPVLRGEAVEGVEVDINIETEQVVASSAPVARKVGKISFLGAASQVSGACFLVEFEDVKFLIDAGIFYENPQTGRPVKQEETLGLYKEFPIPPSALDYIFLSHSHMDHAGRIPYLFALGARPKIVLTPAAKDILNIVLPNNLPSTDFPNDQLEYEEGIKVFHPYMEQCPIGKAISKRNRKTLKMGRHAASESGWQMCSWGIDAQMGEMEAHMITLGYRKSKALTDRLKIQFFPPAHILGASWMKIDYDVTPETTFVIAASGDMGGDRNPLYTRELGNFQVDYALVESTYGGDALEKANEKDVWQDFVPFLKNISQALQEEKLVLLPAFVLDRSHKAIAILQWGIANGIIPKDIPIYLTSANAGKLAGVYKKYALEDDPYFTEEFRKIFNLTAVKNSKRYRGMKPFEPENMKNRREKTYPRPAIVIAHSAMLEHGESHKIVEQMIDDPNLHIVFIGYQSPWTPGGVINNKNKESVKIQGKDRKIKASREMFHVFSSHASGSDLSEWIESVAPREGIFVIHGEKRNSNSLRKKLRTIEGITENIIVPKHEQVIDLMSTRFNQDVKIPDGEESSKELPRPKIGAHVSNKKISNHINVTRINDGNIEIANGLTVLNAKQNGRVKWPLAMTFPRPSVGSRLRSQIKADQSKKTSAPLKVTRITVKKINRKSLIAEAEVVLNDSIKLKEVKLLKNTKGEYWVSAPSTKNGDRYIDHFKFSRELSERIKSRMLAKLGVGKNKTRVKANSSGELKVTYMKDDRVAVGRSLMFYNV
ncbi:MAG: DUF4339 domain-containing protein, partial [Candidatus Lindowbacteria bacterium]|nr:DUF4339 domain-containing protein [Candidatus Lindowbacteria bacterium]